MTHITRISLLGGLGLAIALCMIAAIPAASAQSLLDEVGQATYGTGAGNVTTAAQSVPIIVGNIIRVITGLLGIFFLVLTVYAGFLWMTAQGNEDQVKKAKATLVRAVIGGAIVLSAFIVTSFVISSLQTATSDRASTTQQ